MAHSTAVLYGMDMTTHQLRKVPTSAKNDYVAQCKDTPMYEVLVDGVRIGRVYRSDESHQLSAPGVSYSYGTARDTYWIADEQANDAMTAGSYARGALATRSTRRSAVDVLVTRSAR